MDILILNWRDLNNPHSGGAEYVTFEHAKGWVKYGDRVTWFSSMFPGARNEEVIDGVKIVRRGNSMSVFFFAAVYYFFHRRNVDIMVDQVHGIPFFAAFYARKPIVLFVHEIAGNIWNVMYSAPLSWIGRLLEYWYIHMYRNHMIWTDAQSTVDELVSLGISRDRCRAIPCPIANRPAIRKQKKNPELTCIFVGRIVRMKRIEDLLTAFVDILRAFPRAKLWIVGEGDGSYVASLQKFARTLQISDNVIWHGKASENKKLKLMAQSHLLLHASIKEGWGLVVLEAASQWTPSVVYGVGGLVDTVKDGDTGIIIRTFDPHALARSVIDLRTNTRLYQRMQKRAHEWSGTFRWEDVTKESRALLYQVYKGQ